MSKQTEDFIKKYSSDVIKAAEGKNIFPSLVMAQMIIESSGKDENGKFGIGKGILARKGNNFFGVKAQKGYTGQTISLNTPNDEKKVSLFRSYPSVLDSIKDHNDFLIKNSRYKKAGFFEATNPEQQAQSLDRAFYSETTNPKSKVFKSTDNYSKGLISLIKAYNLKELDKGQTNKSNVILPLGLLLISAIGISWYVSKN